MKFFFSKTDSLYKIFKTLEKIPTGKKVEIFIDPEHALFDNERRGKQLKEIIDQKKLDAQFTTKTTKNREFFRSVGLQTNHIEQRQIKKVVNMFFLFLFNIKRFHLHTYETKKYIFWLIFLFEALLVGVIAWLIISLILPSATIQIQTSEENETIIYNFRYYPGYETKYLEESRYLNIPYYTGKIDYQYTLTVSTANIRHITNPSQGQIKIYNTLPQSYSLVKNTRFVTSDNLVFKAVHDFTIQTGDEKDPSETIVQVQANERDEDEQIIGVKGNIQIHTPMRIKNLNESFYLKEIWAESIEPFSGGSTQSIGSVTEKDIEILSGKLVDQVYKQKLNTVAQYFNIAWGIFLPFESITSTIFHDIQINYNSGDQTPNLKGTAHISYMFHYIKTEDLIKAITTHVKERSSEKTQMINVDISSLKFLKDSSTLSEGEIRKNWSVLIIPTQINIIQGYDFSQDTNRIVPQLKNEVAGKEVEESRKHILSTYPEIGNVKISIFPLRYSTIPSIKSRIKVAIIK